MGRCMRCNRNVSEVSDEDLRNEYAEQADALGMESLTEIQQMLVSGDICDKCYEKESN
jgi:bacterioferritin-associated ferredoxin